ncbi:UNVERIFIED_CONTAM: hypothetical protein FKN15_071959 [Acipenser sinensis]
MEHPTVKQEWLGEGETSSEMERLSQRLREFDTEIAREMEQAKSRTEERQSQQRDRFVTPVPSSPPICSRFHQTGHIAWLCSSTMKYNVATCYLAPEAGKRWGNGREGPCIVDVVIGKHHVMLITPVSFHHYVAALINDDNPVIWSHLLISIRRYQASGIGIYHALF